MDLTTYEDVALEKLRRDVVAEQERRWLLTNAEQQVDAINRSVLVAKGLEEGQPWVQPTGAHDAYPAGWTVTHDGQEWESLTPVNVWEPGVSGWRELVKETAVPAWVQPTGAHDAYKIGDRVTFEGKVWESTINTNTWSPTAYPQGWKEVTDHA